MDGSFAYEDSISDYRRNEQQEMMIAAPLDLSFKNASSMKGMLFNALVMYLIGSTSFYVPLESFRRCRRYLQLPLNHPTPKGLKRHLAEKRPQASRTGKVPLRTPTDRFVTSSLWLSNNSLTSMDGFENLAQKILDDPVYLSWLDLSFNEIGKIGDDILKFLNLKILYLHGNNISNINDVTKLKTLRNLKSLTLHGNPVENLPYYRGYIVHVLPQLATLDFSAVLTAEKKRAPPPGFYKMIHGTT